MLLRNSGVNEGSAPQVCFASTILTVYIFTEMDLTKRICSHNIQYIHTTSIYTISSLHGKEKH